MKRRVTKGFVVSAVVVLGASAAVAQRRDVQRFDATIKCRVDYLNEDQAANLKLIKFELNEDGSQRLVYRCKRSGY